MKGFFAILNSNPIFEIHPAIGGQLLDAAVMVLEKKAAISADLFKVVEANAYVERVEDSESKSVHNFAIIPIHGVMYASDQFCGPVGMLSRADEILNAAFNPSVNGILLNIMTPGGQALGTEELANAIDIAREQKPVLAYVNGMAASAGYKTAIYADHIMLNGVGAEVGSIGTMLSYRDLSERMKQKGVREVQVVSNLSPNKNKFNFNNPTEEDLEVIKTEMLDPLTQLFHDKVKSRRPGIDESALKGDMFLGQKAIDLGMADSIGNMQDAMAWLVNASEPQKDGDMFKIGKKEKESGKPSEEATQLDQLQQAHEAAITALNETHQTAIADLTQQIAELTQQVEDGNTRATELESQIETLKKKPVNKVEDPEGDEGVPGEDADQQKGDKEPSWSGFGKERLG